MERTTISLSPELHRKLRIIAAERGISMAGLIREALEEKTVTRKRKFASAGIGASGHGRLAEDASDLRLDPPSWRS